MKAPAPDVSAHRAKSAEGGSIEKVLDYFIVSESLSTQISKVDFYRGVLCLTTQAGEVCCVVKRN